MRPEDRATEKLEESGSRTDEVHPDEVHPDEYKWKRRPRPSFPFLQ